METAKIPTLRFCFKGTDDKHTGKADIEIRAGAESYRRGERQILEQGSAVINDCHARLPKGKKFEVEVIGHSLGGALAELCFNTWQRTIAQCLAARDSSLSVQVQKLEKTFINEESKLIGDVDHQQYISDITVDSDIISGLSLNVANAAGVSLPVQTFSNELAKILVDNGVKQAANYIKISADPVGASGRGILNKVPDYKAHVSVLYIEREILNHKFSALSAAGCLFAPVSLVALVSGKKGV